MGVNLPELDLNSSPVDVVPNSICQFFKEIEKINDLDKRSSKINAFADQIEDEFRELDGREGEVPFSRMFLKDVVGRLKEYKMQGEKPEVQHGNLDEWAGAKTSSDSDEKKDWLSSAKLWRSADITCGNFDLNKQDSGSNLKLKENGSTFAMIEESEVLGFDKDQRRQAQSTRFQLLSHQRNKQRRSWTEELHNRFVQAVEHLGEKATPKHIKAVMQVDELTNDQIKSHLQKYRIHLKKVQQLEEAMTRSYEPMRFALNRYQEMGKANMGQSISSPQGPLYFTGFGGGVSTTGGSSKESEEEDKSESPGWKWGAL